MWNERQTKRSMGSEWERLIGSENSESIMDGLKTDESHVAGDEVCIEHRARGSER